MWLSSSSTTPTLTTLKLTGRMRYLHYFVLLYILRTLIVFTLGLVRANRLQYIQCSHHVKEICYCGSQLLCNSASGLYNVFFIAIF